MSRLTDNWIDSYVELMARTEPAKLFDIWTAYSVVASALRRKVYLKLGRLTYHTNIYVVLVAEPGVARKTQAIKFGVDFINTIPEIILSSDSATKEALTDDIEGSSLEAVMDSGEIMRHSSLSIISKEFESFLGQKKENNRMLTALTDLFDCPDYWSARTRHGKSNKIVNPWVNMLAATTPESLANSLPASAVGGGLTSRILFIWADKKKLSSAIPDMNEKEIKLKDKLERDLYQISRMSGQYAMSSQCMKKWVEWYDAYDEDESGIRICRDKSFSGWYSRKPTYIMKVSMLVAASESNKLLIEWNHVERAIEEIKQVEQLMGSAFKAIGRSEISGDVSTVYEIVRSHNVISEKALMAMTWRDLDNIKLGTVVDTLIKAGKICRDYKGPNKEPGVWYKCVDFSL